MIGSGTNSFAIAGCASLIIIQPTILYKSIVDSDGIEPGFNSLIGSLIDSGLTPLIAIFHDS